MIKRAKRQKRPFVILIRVRAEFLRENSPSFPAAKFSRNNGFLSRDDAQYTVSSGRENNGQTQKWFARCNARFIVICCVCGRGKFTRFRYLTDSYDGSYFPENKILCTLIMWMLKLDNYPLSHSFGMIDRFDVEVNKIRGRNAEYWESV